MIHIQKGQEVVGNTEFISIAPTGDYDEIDLLECARKDRPDFPYCMFQAQCIKFGSMVYQQDEVLTDKQVELLLAGSTEQIIGNRKYIDGFVRPGVRGGKIIGKNGVLFDWSVATEPAEVPNEPQEPDEPSAPEPEPSTPDVPVDTVPTGPTDDAPIDIPKDISPSDVDIKARPVIDKTLEKVIDTVMPGATSLRLQKDLKKIASRGVSAKSKNKKSWHSRT